MKMTGIFPLQTRRGKMKLAQTSMDIGIADLALLNHIESEQIFPFLRLRFCLPNFLSSLLSNHS